MTGCVRAVHPALRTCLAGPMVAYDETLPPTAVHLGVPSPTATVIIAFDEPLHLGWLTTPLRADRYWASVSGMHLGPALIRTHGLQRGIQLDLTPTGCRALFGVPIGALHWTTASMAELPRGLTTVEHEQLAQAQASDTRLALLEEQLLRRLEPTAPPRDIAQAWRMLVSGHDVGRTAAEVGWSRRHLLTRMRGEIGLTPRDLGRLGRFHRARTLVRDGEQLARAAALAGYADQAHLSREWKEFAGRSPRNSAEEFPNVQDVIPGGLPDLGA